MEVPLFSIALGVIPTSSWFPYMWVSLKMGYAKKIVISVGKMTTRMPDADADADNDEDDYDDEDDEDEGDGHGNIMCIYIYIW